MISHCCVYLLCLELGCLGSHPVADDTACLTERPSRPLSTINVQVKVKTAHVECVVGDAVAAAASSCSSAPDAES